MKWNEAFKSNETPENQNIALTSLQNESFRQLWEKKYFLNLPAIKELILYPKDTLGYEYAAHILQNKITATFYPIRVPQSPAQYLSLLSRQTHELWHVLTSYDTSFLGEAALHSFYTAQTGSASSAASVANGILTVAAKNPLDIHSFFTQMSEAFERGRKCKFLLGTQWESYLEMPLDRVRAELGL